MKTILNKRKIYAENLLRVTLFLGILAMPFSCFEDKGNYDYVDLDEVLIDTAGKGILPKYAVERYSNLVIEPDIYINGKLVTETSDVPYDFIWTIYSNGTGVGAIYRHDTLATTAKLDAIITQPISTSGWTALLTVSNRETDVKTYIDFKVDIEEVISDGWMVLYERDGNTDVGLIVNDGIKKFLTPDYEKLLLDLYSASAGKHLAGKPVGTFLSLGGAGLAGGGDIVLVSENDAVVLTNTFDPLYSFSELFWTEPQHRNISCWVTGGNIQGMKEMMINNNRVQTRGTNGSRATYFYGDPCIGNHGELAPWSTSLFGNRDALVYDQTNTGFRVVENAGFEVMPFTEQSKDAKFDVNNTGMRMVASDWGRGTGTANTFYEYSLMNNGSEYALLVSNFFGSTTATTSVAIEKYDLSSAPDISQATTVAAGTLGQVFYYGAGNKVYLYSYGTNTPVEKVWEGSDSEVVTCVRIQKFYFGTISTAALMNNNSRVYISTWNESTQTGTVYQAIMDPTSGAISTTGVRSYTGFGKVKDMNWKWALIMG